MSMKRIPSAWGSSWARLQKRFTLTQRLSPTDAVMLDGTAISLPLTAGAGNGVSGDFLKLDFFSNLAPTSKMEIEINWISEIGPSSARFVAANGTNLIPLGACPDWLLSKTISDLKIVPVEPPLELKYSVRNVQLLQLRD
jgi:hypothetical protein